MFRALHSRRVAIAIVLLLAVAAIVVPTARIVGCSLSSGFGGAMAWSGSNALGFFADCGAELAVTATLVTGAPSAFVLTALSLVALLFITILRDAPRLQMATCPARSSDPPPEPPEDSLGARLSL